MQKCFMIWEVDQTTVPVEVKERAVLFNGRIEMTKQQTKDAKIEDRDVFVVEGRECSGIEQRRLDNIKNLRNIIFHC